LTTWAETLVIGVSSRCCHSSEQDEQSSHFYLRPELQGLLSVKTELTGQLKSSSPYDTEIPATKRNLPNPKARIKPDRNRTEGSLRQGSAHISTTLPLMRSLLARPYPSLLAAAAGAAAASAARRSATAASRAGRGDRMEMEVGLGADDDGVRWGSGPARPRADLVDVSRSRT
jgi:hypothetical protein